MNLSSVSQPLISSLVEALAKISAYPVIDQDLLEFMAACFLNTSDVWSSTTLNISYLKTLKDSSQVTMERIFGKSYTRLQRWGIVLPGKYETEIATSPKTENVYISLVITGEVRATIPRSYKKSLVEIFNGGIGINSYTGQVLENAYTLRANTHKLGRSNASHPNTFAVVYRSPGGDRVYPAELGADAPTLRGVGNTDKKGKLGGTGAYRIRENAIERPITPQEAEQLMGWPIDSTAQGITAKGDRINISNSQRIGMLGKGIIPQEITEILEGITPYITRKLEQQIPPSKRMVYQQLRNIGKTHRQALAMLVQ
ncbi:MAG TPA: hypothetical protein VK184_05430 [Nostocaceae cyanobacterium]|nr:hypothetical protein [Nostocaceae cyanobacterium]